MLEIAIAKTDEFRDAECVLQPRGRSGLVFGELLIRLEAGYFVIGRSVECDLVLDDASVSARHAAVTCEGPEMVLWPMGRNGVLLQNEAVSSPTVLEDGDVFEIGGKKLTVVCEPSGLVRPPGCFVQVGSGPLIRVPDPGLSITEAEPAGQPRSRESKAGRRGIVRAIVAADATIVLEKANGDVDTQHVQAEAVFLVCDTVVRIIGDSPINPTDTLPTRDPGELDEISVQFLPSGARLRVVHDSTEAVVTLPELRANLVAALLRPGEGQEPGEFMSDDLVASRVWPRSNNKGRVDVNILIHRFRSDLLRAGIDPFLVVERSPYGGATRVRVGGHSSVEVS